MKESLTFNSTPSYKLVNWNSSTDCCAWGGVTCSGDGHVIGLHLPFSRLQGKFPEKIFQLPHLQSLDLTSNYLLHGVMPEFPKNSSLQRVFLRYTSFGGHLPQSIGNLRKLSGIDLIGCNFSGRIPDAMANLTELVSLDFSSNNFLGPMPSFSSAKNLSYISLSNNHFSGSILSTNWSDFLKLRNLYLDGNKLEGPFPTSLFQLENLTHLRLSSNNLSGPLNLSQFQQLKNLVDLRLSYNSFSINISGIDPPTSFPTLNFLELASCNLTGLPAFLKDQPNLLELDLSNNQIGGVVPDWLWALKSLKLLDLSHNLLLDVQAPSMGSNFSLAFLDLSNNNLQGEVLTKIKMANYMSLSNNFIQGSIPQSICNVSLGLLDLSNNSLNGTIPQCLFGMGSLIVLKLRGNNLSGNIPDTFSSKRRNDLQTLDLNGNQLEGEIPRSLTFCNQLEVLDLGNNQISDVFPCHLKNLSSLRVLVLRSNNFHGPIGCLDNYSSWTMLQIVDLAYNNFRGQIPTQFLRTWKAMIDGKDELQSIGYNFRVYYYQNAVTVTMKGREYELVRILTVFTSIDFSHNKLEGAIPEVMGEFKALRILNMSHNAFSGQIPISFGDLRRLESMDLSSNHLSDKIPQELADLNSLAVLNLSNNQLAGRIPTSSQFQTFSNDSFQASNGLCGFPLTKSCGEDMKQCDVHWEENCRVDHSYGGSLIEWNFLSVELGIIFGLAIVVLPLMFWRRWRIWYFRHIDTPLSRLFPRLIRRSGNRGSRSSRRSMNKMAGEVAVQAKVSRSLRTGRRTRGVIAV